MNKILWFIVFVLAGVSIYLYVTDGKISTPNTDTSATEETSTDDTDTNKNTDAKTSEAVNSNPVTTVTPSKPNPAPVPTPTPAPAPRPARDEDGNIIVRYTSYGFDPQSVEIAPGDAIRFLNTDISSMWVKAQEHPTEEYFEYAALDQGRSSYMGESYVFTFTKVGTWGYTNLNKDKHKGVVIVVE